MVLVSAMFWLICFVSFFLGQVTARPSGARHNSLRETAVRAEVGGGGTR